MSGNGTKTSIDYSIVPISNKDSDRVIDFLRCNFFRDEPLTASHDGARGTQTELEQFCIDSIREGISLMAVSPNGNIVGVRLNGILCRGQEDCEEDSESEVNECSDPSFHKIMKLLKTVHQKSDVFGRFPQVEKLLEMRLASVHEAYRSRGIYKALVERTKLLAREMRIPLIRVDCTSHFSAKALTHLGFQCVYTLNYSEYLDTDGKPVFVPELPHTCVKTFVCPVHLTQ